MKPKTNTLMLWCLLVVTGLLLPQTGFGGLEQELDPVLMDALRIVDPSVLTKIEQEGVADFMVVLLEQADLSSARQLRSKVDKGRFVFQTLVRVAERTQKPLLKQLTQRGLEYRSFYIQNMVLVRNGTLEALLDMALRADVALIRANKPMQFYEPQPLAYRDDEGPKAPEWNLAHIGITDVWSEGITGEGTVVANLDTGVDWDHPALIQHYRGWSSGGTTHDYNWHACSTSSYCPNAAIPCDDDSHGTHTMGTMVGDDGGSNQIGGAPGAKWIACGHLEDSAGFHECFEWFLAPYRYGEQPSQGLPEMAPDVVNNSWGWPVGGGDYQYAPDLNALQAAGVFMEFSAGNEGDYCESLRSPGDYPQVLTTGASDVQDRIVSESWSGWWGSSRGPASSGIPGAPNFIKPEIVAPGYDIRSSIPGTSYEGGWGGTSMAGPHTCAVVALMWSAAPSLRGDIEATRQIILDNAFTQQGGAGYWNQTCNGINAATTVPNHVWGWGLIDAYACYEALAGVYLDQNAYQPTDTIGILVRDRTSTGSVTVQIKSTTEVQWEQVVLTEEATGVFSGQIPCAPVAPAPGDGILSVAHGDTATCYYSVLDFTTTATIDGLEPTISNVQVESISDNWALITWTTNELANSVVYYGIGTPTDSVIDEAYALEHEVVVEGLDQCTTYRFDVGSYDQAGNEALDDNNGQHYVFQTYERVVFLEETMDVNPNWTISGGQWAWGTPTGSCSDPTSGYTGTSVYGYNLQGCYPNSMSTYYLTTPAFDCTTATEVIFSFYRWLGVESSSYDHARVQVSNNNSTWTTLWENGSSMQDSSWQFMEFDISDEAVGYSQVRIRWVMGTTDGSVTYSGWNIDDVMISQIGPCTQPTTTPFPPTLTPTPTPSTTPTMPPSPTPTLTPTDTATPVVTATPTQPTATPTSRPTDSPTATPIAPTVTPVPGIVVDIVTNQTSYRMGDQFLLISSVTNSGPEVLLDTYIILDLTNLGAPYYFWPTWGTDLDSRLIQYPAFDVVTEEVLNFEWPPGAGAAQGLVFWMGLLEPQTMNLVGNLDWVEFSFE